jgi:hypothetical protein
MKPETSTRFRFIVGALGLALLFGPWLAFATGARSDPVAAENRALAKRPTWRGFATLQQITDFAADHFPLRDNAIRANKRLGNIASSRGPASPNEERINALTLKGKDGWLFAADDFNRACHPETPLPQVIDGLRRLNAIITGSGREFVVAIIPDKSSFETRFLPDRYPLQHCSEPARAQRRKALLGLELPGLVDLLPLLRNDEKQTGKPAYQAFDTHWTDRSGALFVRAVAEKLDPALAAGTELRSTKVSNGKRDLAVYAGDNRSHPDPIWDIVRLGVKPTVTKSPLGPTNGPDDAYETRVTTATTTGPAALFSPKTFWIGDSFSDHALHQYSTYFADLTEVPDLVKAKSVGVGRDGQDLYDLMLPRVLQGIKDSKVVVMEAVERFFFAAPQGALTADDFLNRLEAALRAPE